MAANPRAIRSSEDIHDAVAADSPSSPPTTTKGSTLLRWKSSEAYFPPFLLKKVLAEVIATFLLVFVTCGAAAMSRSNEGLVSKLGASVAGGLIVTVMIYAVGHISGAHMNPAVTFAFAALRHFPWIQVPFYMAAQLAGAMAASFTLRELLHPVADIGTTTPARTATQALVMEIVVTFSMMFVTSAVATDTKAVGELAGLAVGSAVCITSIVAGPISGGSMNPARSIGPALASEKYDGLWVYVIGPFLGTLMGCGSYSLIRVPNGQLSAATSRTQSCSFKLRRLGSSEGSQSSTEGS